MNRGNDSRRRSNGQSAARRPQSVDATAPDAASAELGSIPSNDDSTPVRAGWRLSERKVDRADEHFELRYGDARGDQGWGDWIPVALVGPPVESAFNVEFLPGSDGRPLNPDIVRAARQELTFYLVEKGERDPWRYAQYHVGTQANLYSLVHWRYVEAEKSKEWLAARKCTVCGGSGYAPRRAKVGDEASEIWLQCKGSGLHEWWRDPGDG